MKLARILHVLTLDGPNGEYGGPSRVAEQVSKELGSRGYDVHLFSGAYPRSGEISSLGFKRHFTYVQPLSKKYPISSLWSFNLPLKLVSQVRASHVVHIHFARDLIPVAAGFMCLLLGKPYVLQTHGMIVLDARLVTRFMDFFFIKPLLKRSRSNLLLNKSEYDALRRVYSDIKHEIITNGIEPSPVQKSFNTKELRNTIVFCSRLDTRKRPELFIELARYSQEKGLKNNFQIFGPDYGELTTLNNFIETEKLSNIEYRGALKGEDVIEMLAQASLLVLPSADEPFPMIALESLSVGTSILLMPSCGISETVARSWPSFVAKKETKEGLIEAFNLLVDQDFLLDRHNEIQVFCRENFGIKTVVNNLERVYRNSFYEKR